MTDISHSDNTVFIGDTAVEFDSDISDITIIEDLIIVKFRIKDLSEDYPGRNMIALDRDGSIRWRIEEGYGRKTKRPYHSIRYEDGRLIAKCLDSHMYEVDMETGEVEQIRRYDK